MNSEDNMDLGKIDAEMKKGIDARTKEFKEKLTKLTYEKIKAKLVPSKEPLKGYPHNEAIEENSKEYQKDMDMIAGMIKKGEHKRVAGLIKRTAALKGGGGWNLQQKPSKAQKDQYNKMVRDHKKSHRALYASYNEEVTISMDETINEAVKAKSGKGIADIDYVGDKKLTAKIEKLFKIKIKQTGNTTADVTGNAKDIVNFLTKHYYYDDSDIKDMYSDLVESVQVNEGIKDLKNYKDRNRRGEARLTIEVTKGNTSNKFDDDFGFDQKEMGIMDKVVSKVRNMHISSFDGGDTGPASIEFIGKTASLTKFANDRDVKKICAKYKCKVIGPIKEVKEGVSSYKKMFESNLEEMNARYEISDMEQSKDPAVKSAYAKLKKAKYPSMQYIRQYKEVEAALDKSLPANKRKK